MPRFFALLVFIISVSQVHAKSITVVPREAGKPIAQAIFSAANGDTLFIESGHYLERNIHIDKPLTIIGREWPVVDARDTGFVFIVKSDNVWIEGLEINHAGVSFIDDNAAVKLDEVRHCTIINNRLRNNFFGIYLAKSADCLVSGNDIRSVAKRETNSGNGIHLWYCKNIRVTQNKIKHHRDGIYFEFVEYSLIENNLSTENLRYGLHFMFSDDCIYRKNTFLNNGAGVAVMYTHRVTMEENTFQQNWGSASFGLLLKEITNSKVEKNQFIKNSIGLYSEGSNRNHIRFNTFIQNGYGVKLMANSMDNEFTENNFIDNSFEVATNSRQNFNRFYKNYWSQYTGYDLDKDGLGDVPHKPVSLFSFLVQQNEPVIIFMHSLFVDLLNSAEMIFPQMTPATLLDKTPRMKRIQ